MSLEDFFVTYINENLKLILVHVLIIAISLITIEKLQSIQRREAKELMQVISELKID